MIACVKTVISVSTDIFYQKDKAKWGSHISKCLTSSTSMLTPGGHTFTHSLTRNVAQMWMGTEVTAIYEPHQISPGRNEEIQQNLGVMIVRFKTGSLHTVRLDVSGYDILNADRSSSRFGRIHLSPSSDQTIWCDEGSSRTLLKVTTFVLQFKASHPRRNNPRASSEYNIQGVSRL